MRGNTVANLIFSNGQLATSKATKIVWFGKILECWDMIWGVRVNIELRTMEDDGRRPRYNGGIFFFVNMTFDIARNVLNCVT